MNTQQTIVCIDLIKEHKDHGYKDLFQTFKSKNKGYVKFSDYNADLNLKTGDVVVFVGGHDSNVEFRSEILGFNDAGYAYVLWDCYWMAIDLKSRLVKS